MIVENDSLSWLREAKTEKNPLRETQDVFPCVRMNRQWRDGRSGENGESACVRKNDSESQSAHEDEPKWKESVVVFLPT